MREWVSGPPDFVGVGAQRCGTTWWWRLLCNHPRIHEGAGKETHFFDGYYEREFTNGDVDAYHNLFSRPAGSLTGEWCPSYLHQFWVSALLHRAVPDARILVMLRDPLRRYQSGLSHDLALLKRSVRGRRRAYVLAMSANAALTRSLYARQLRVLFEHFERSQILILQYERCLEDPLRELQRTYAFVGAEDHQPPATVINRKGFSPPQLDSPEAVSGAARRAILRDAEELSVLVPEIELDLWPSCRAVAAESPE